MWTFVKEIITSFRHSPCRGWLAIFLVANLFINLPNNTNPRSRLATLCAMVEDHSFCIDNYKDLTIDWARTPDGHYYSNKAPGPMLLGYPVFWVVDKALTGHHPDRAARDRLRLEYSWLTFKLLSMLLQVLPFFVLVLMSLRWLEDRGVSRAALHVSCVAMLFGNTATLFMNTYFGHAMAANAVLALVLCLLSRQYTGSGLAFGLALLADYGSAALLPGFALAVALREPVKGWLGCGGRIALGALLPAILWTFYHLTCFAGPFTLPSRYQNPLFVDTARYTILGIFSLSPDPMVAAKLLVGFRRGILWSQPWLLVVLAGLLLWRHSLKSMVASTWTACRPLLLFLLPGFMLLLWMNASFGEWHAGSSPGPRYMCSVFPACGLLAGALYDGLSLFWRRWMVATVAFSALYWITIYSTNHMVPDISLWSHTLGLLFNEPTVGSMCRVIVLVIVFEWQFLRTWRECHSTSVTVSRVPSPGDWG